MHRILLVDDEPGVLAAIGRILRQSPLIVRGETWRPRVDAFESPQAALVKASECAYDLVVSDYRMPIMDGVEFLTRFRELQPDCGRMILSGYTDLNGLIGAINTARIERFVGKPWNDFELVSAMAQVLETQSLRLENQVLADQMRLAQGRLSAVELELKRLEAMEPGITRVQWGDDGSVIIDMDELLTASGGHGLAK